MTDFNDFISGATAPSGTVKVPAVVDGSTPTRALTVTTAGAALLDDADAEAQRTTLGAAAASHAHAGTDITSGTVAAARLPSATTSASGIVELATDGENAANVVVQGNDARLAIPATISLDDSANATDGRDHLLTGGASKTLTLPNPATNSVIAVSNRSGNSWTIGRTGSDSIEGSAANDTLANNKDVVYRYRATNHWRRIGSLS